MDNKDHKMILQMYLPFEKYILEEFDKYFLKGLELTYFDPFWSQFQREQVQIEAHLLRKSINTSINKEVSITTKYQCSACRVELCEYLDAYYGKDPISARHCAKCRDKKRLI